MRYAVFGVQKKKLVFVPLGFSHPGDAQRALFKHGVTQMGSLAEISEQFRDMT